MSSAVSPGPAGGAEVRERIAALVDTGTLEPIGLDGLDGGATAATGRIDGAPVVVYATDSSVMGGAMGAEGCAHIVNAIETAIRRRVPVIGLWHSGGARLVEGVAALAGVGEVFAAMVRASGLVPQISVVLGPAAGGAAYGPALTDLVIMSPAGRMFVTGPDVVREVTGEEVDAEALGGPSIHGRRSGVVHVVAASEDDALARARRLVGFLTVPHARRVSASPSGSTDPSGVLPPARRRAYDVRPLLTALLDAPSSDLDGVQELQALWAPNMVTLLGRLEGRAVGVIANNPLRMGGCLDSAAAEKAARFVRLCDAFGLPLLVVVDVPGYLPGVDQEWEGLVRRGAKLLHAFAAASVPRITLITRKAYGGAFVAMNSRALGANAVFAWPGAEVAVMSARAAVGITARRQLAAARDEEREELHAALAAEFERRAGGIEYARTIGAVDEVIDPATTRIRLLRAYDEAPVRSGHHSNIPL